MHAKDETLLRFLGGADKKFIIPVYQRSYSWLKDDCERLVKDLLSVYRDKRDSHFFGSIVSVGNVYGSLSEYIIVDGQQRITTISLLLLAIRDYVTTMPDTDFGIQTDKITDEYLTNKYSADEKKLKLKLVQGDDYAYDCIIKKDSLVENNLLTANYRYFLSILKKISKEEILGIYNAISTLKIVNITLEPSHGDDPQLIFESLNSTGQRLDEADKIRNFILMRLIGKDQEDFYHKYWEKLEKLVSHAELEDFFRYYLAVKKRELVKADRLYFAFKDFRGQKSDLHKNEELFDEILMYASVYEEIKKSCGHKEDINNVLKRINSLEIKSITPLLLDVFVAKKQEKMDDGELFQLLCTLESYIIRRLICDGSKGFNKLFVSVGAEVEKHVQRGEENYYNALKCALLAKTGKSRFPKNQEFKDKFLYFDFYNSPHTIIKFVFEAIENYNNRELVAVKEQINNGTLTIEHVMPQTLTSQWKKDLGENFELIYSKYLDTIGNLTLTAYNPDYSNSPFTIKKNMPEKGFSSSKLQLNSFMKECEVWGENEITQRAEKLFSIAELLWPYPEAPLSSSVDIEGEWVYWDDDFVFTNRTVSKICVLNDEIKTENITDVYKKVCSVLYGLDSARFVSMPFTWFGSDASMFIEAYQIGPQAYINTNINSNGKMSALKELAMFFQLASEDVKYYVENPFDINDEGTYRQLSPGKLAYQLIQNLILEKRISADEIQLLKSKEYSRSNFYKVVYPVLADRRDDNRGTSSKFRYYKQPVSYNGVDIYISSEWFDETRDDLVTWYKRHF